MAYTINRRLGELIDSTGQLNDGKIPNDYINGDHIADNTITSSMLHTTFSVPAASLTGIDTDDVSEGATNLYYTDARVGSYLTANSYATQSYVSTAVSNLVDSAPATLDTLNELAAALGDDPNFATTVSTNIGTKVSKSGDTMTGTLNGTNFISGGGTPTGSVIGGVRAYEQLKLICVLQMSQGEQPFLA